MFPYEPRVSIIIPAYNASDFLAEAIDSALSQTYPNIEIIVVNDGSEDDGATARVALSYGDMIRYYEKENGGSSSALNYGISVMTGEWFSWLSHDDVYYPDKVEEQIKCINSLDVDFLNADELQRHVFVAPADLINGSGSIIQRFSKKKIVDSNKIINSKDGNARLIAEPIQGRFHGCSCLIHKKAFETVGYFDERLKLLNDMDLWFRFYSKGYCIHYIPKVLVKGRVHANQISNKIGYSFHNQEQDAFWNRNLKWLEENYPDSYEYYMLYGKTAYKKTRHIEGKRALQHAKRIRPRNKVLIDFVALFYSIQSIISVLGKKVYMRITA